MGKTTIKILALVLVLSAGILLYVLFKQKKAAAEAEKNKQAPAPQPTGGGTRYAGIKPTPGNGVAETKALLKPVGDDKFPLVQGSRGKNVTLLQLSLNYGGAKLKVDGAFGPATAAALKKQWNDVDGINEGEFNMIVFDFPVRGAIPVHLLPILKVGSKGYWVQVLQAILGIPPTGTFADGTANELKKNGYVTGMITVQQLIAIGKVKDPLAVTPYVDPVNYTFNPINF